MPGTNFNIASYEKGKICMKYPKKTLIHTQSWRRHKSTYKRYLCHFLCKTGSKTICCSIISMEYAECKLKHASFGSIRL